MITLLQDDWHLRLEFDLLDAGGAMIARVSSRSDGSVEVRPDLYGLSGFWKREAETLCIVDSSASPVARFNCEGLDGKGRKLIWGLVKVGPHWLEHCLRVDLRPTPRISFCISSRGRLHHVRQTLPQNIADNQDYPNLEFVLLDYNSSDGLGDWVRQELGDEIASGRLSYYFAPHPDHFHATHSRNMSIRLATGEIVCVVDADNFTGRGFASYLADNVRPDKFLIGCRMEGDDFAPMHDQGAVGRYAIYKKAFLDVGGMDEQHVGWGYDDVDLYSRLRAKGYRCQSIEPRYIKCIAHDDAERRKELKYQDIGRDKTSGDGSVWVNARRSQANIDAGRVVLNDGRIGCGEVIRNFGESNVVVRERRNPVISICIACGDQTEELRQHFAANLHALRYQPNLEFVILDGPEGSLEAWLQANFPGEIETGRIVYCRMITPYGQQRCINVVRQQNIAARQARGDVVCMLVPADRIALETLVELGHKFHEGWIAEGLGSAGFSLSRHLFHLVEGLDQTRTPDQAAADLLHRVAQRLSGDATPVWNRSGLESRDFGGGTVIRNGAPVVISPHRFPRVSLTMSVDEGVELEAAKAALSQILEDNRDYPNLEIVIVDHGSTDALSEWVHGEMSALVSAKRLVYFRGHAGDAESGNMAMRLATGEIVGRVDARVPTGHHFAFHVAERLQQYDYLSACRSFAGHESPPCRPGNEAPFVVRREVYYSSLGSEVDPRASAELCRSLEAAGYRGGDIDGRFLPGAASGTATSLTGRSAGIRRDGVPSLRNFDGLPVEVKPYRFERISFCITCMDRVHHLAKTLPRNLQDNRNYPNIEFVLLDYNSSDGLEAWARQNLGEWLDSGKLVYFRTTDPDFFHRGHARNLAIRLATGDIICTLDADNFTGPDFAHYINERFQRYESIFLRPDFEGAHVRLTDAFGRICARKRDLLRIEGYDEQLADYGFEDLDLCVRLEKSGLEPRFIEGERFLNYIHHGNRDRMANGPVIARSSLLLRGRGRGNEWESIVYLLRDGGFIWQGPQIDGVPTHGSWSEISGGVLLTCGEGQSTASLKASDDGQSYHFEHLNSDLRLRPSEDLDFFCDAVKDLAMDKNGRRYNRNLVMADSRVNEGSFGDARVSRNFSEQVMSIDLIDRRSGK